jgi:hypothetical protein
MRSVGLERPTSALVEPPARPPANMAQRKSAAVLPSATRHHVSRPEARSPRRSSWSDSAQIISSITSSRRSRTPLRSVRRTLRSASTRSQSPAKMEIALPQIARVAGAPRRTSPRSTTSSCKRVAECTSSTAIASSTARASTPPPALAARSTHIGRRRLPPSATRCPAPLWDGPLLVLAERGIEAALDPGHVGLNEARQLAEAIAEVLELPTFAEGLEPLEHGGSARVRWGRDQLGHPASSFAGYLDPRVSGFRKF